jgi:bla regulator protein BlaR1
MTDHLVQSTLFAGVMALVAWALRNNAAKVRHSLWLAASIKFLIPFSLLMDLGSRVQWRSAAPPRLSFVLEGVSQGLAATAIHVTVPASPSVNWPMIAGMIWLCGCAMVSMRWASRWWRVRSTVLRASRLEWDAEVDVMSSPALLEPGVFGVLRPVLLLPSGIAEQLTAEQMEAIIAHELCHVRRRDNLAAAIHMVVEALFWFHPLVWWIGARLVEERERACDEEVLRMGNEPEVYAEGILKICRLYLESPVACVSGVTSSDLKKRIEGIMTNGFGQELDFARKLLLAVVGCGAIVAPIAVGIVNAPPMSAQSQPEKRLAFEVASVKPTKGGNRFGWDFNPSGRFTAEGLPLQVLVAVAYNVPFQGPRITGIDQAMNAEQYDIEATAESGAIPAGAPRLVRETKMRLMLQTLLAERFKLKIRVETKELPVYAVLVGKGGPKLKKASIEEKDCPDGPTADGPGCHKLGGGQGRGIHGKAVSIADVVLFVGNWTDRPIVDRTGLDALWEIDTDGWIPMRPRPQGGNEEEARAMNDPTRPTLYMIFERLGLKMESSKAPIEMYIVEHAEKPTEN